MKKTILLFLFFTLGLLLYNADSALAQCTWRIEMQDSFGDGWNGASLDVTVAGVATNITATGSGSTYTFTVNGGDNIQLGFNSGSWDSEITYQLIDPFGNTLFADGTNPTVGANVFSTTGYCCPPCSYTINMFDSFGDGWNGGFLTVYLNGTSLGNISVPGGSSNSVNVFVSNGDVLSLDYTSGSWESENSYNVVDNTGATVFTDAAPPTVGANVFTSAPVTGCSGGGANDVGVSAVTAIPASPCVAQSFAVEVTIENFGTSAQTNIPVTVDVPGGTPATITGTYTGTIGACGSATFVVGNATFLNSGTATLTAETTLAGDSDGSNNSSTVSVTSTTSGAAPMVGTANITACSNASQTLNATTGGVPGTLTWYSSPTGSPVGTGINYNTPTLSPGTTTYYVRTEPDNPPVFKITEIQQFLLGDGATVALPSYIPAAAQESWDDMVEITNLGGDGNLGGFQFQLVGTGGDRTYTFPGTINVPSGGTVLLYIGDDVADDPANFFFTTQPANTSGTSTENPVVSGDAAGYILRDAGATIVDVAATNSYANWAADGAADVTAAEWSGNVASSAGQAGIIRDVSDNDNASDWSVASAANQQDMGTTNAGLTPSFTCPTPFSTVTIDYNPPSATATASPSFPANPGDNVTLASNFSGTGPFDISWSDGTTTFGAQTGLAGPTTSVVVNPTATTTYTITVTDNNGCTATASATVNFPTGGGGGGGNTQTLVAPFEISATAQDTASVLVRWMDSNVDEQGYYLYRAVENGSYMLLAIVPAPVRGGEITYMDTDLMPDTQYTYYVVAYRGAETSTHSDQAEDITYPLPPMTSLVTAACYGGQGLAEAYGPHTSQVYRWYNDDDPTTEPITGGSGQEVSTAQFTTPNLMNDQTYYVTAVGRRYESTPRVAITVPVIPRPTAEILTDAAGNMATVVESCGSSYDLSAMLADSSAVYEWFNRFGGKVADGMSYTVTTPGTYYLKVTQNGCSAISQDVNVRLNTAPDARILQGASVIFCQGGTLSSNEIRNATYEWTFDGNVIGTTREVTASQAGTYTLNVTRGNCTTTVTTDVTLREFPTDLTLSTGDTDLCPGEMSFIESPTQAGTSYELFRNDRVFSRSDNNRFDINTPGEYFVRITYGGACYAETERVTIHYNDIPQASLKRIENQITLNIQNSANFQSIDWFLDGAAAPSFANQQAITVSQEGNYRAEVTYPSGCTTLTGSVYYYERVTGIEDQPETANALTLFPNPTQGKLQVRFGQALNESVSFRITDALGRTLQTGKWEAGTRQAQLSLENLPAGLYTLSLTGEVEGNFRLVKED